MKKITVVLTVDEANRIALLRSWRDDSTLQAAIARVKAALRCPVRTWTDEDMRLAMETAQGLDDARLKELGLTLRDWIAAYLEVAHG